MLKWGSRKNGYILVRLTLPLHLPEAHHVSVIRIPYTAQRRAVYGKYIPQGPRDFPRAEILYLEARGWRAQMYFLHENLFCFVYLVSTTNVLTFCLPANVNIVPICTIAGAFSMFSARGCVQYSPFKCLKGSISQYTPLRAGIVLCNMISGNLLGLLLAVYGFTIILVARPDHKRGRGGNTYGQPSRKISVL